VINFTRPDPDQKDSVNPNVYELAGFISRRKLPKMYGENFRQALNELSNNKLHI